MMGMFIILTVVKFHKCIYVSKLIKEHSKYVQQVNVSYASMKQLLKNMYAQPFEGFTLREPSHKGISTHLCTMWPSRPFSPLFTLPSHSPEELTVLSELAFFPLFVHSSTTSWKRGSRI